MSTDARHLAAQLLAPARSAPPLRPSKPYDATLTAQINALHDPVAVRAALHLANDDVESAHNLAQGDEGVRTSDYVHAQLHRREGDYWNSKWWLGTGMRGGHPVLQRVHGGAAGGKSFVDSCEKIGKGRSGDGALEEKQWEELKATVEYALENDSK